MRIGINARSLASPQLRGWTRYTTQLLRYLPACGAELVLFTDTPLQRAHLDLLPRGSFRVVQSPKLRYLVWEQVWLPRACSRERIELLHAPANYGLPRLGRAPMVLTLHDAIDLAFEPAAPSLRARLVQASFWSARAAAQRIITVSAHAKADLLRHFSLPESRVTVIHEASDLSERAASESEEQALVRSLGLPTGRFVLYAGGFEKRKNVGLLVRAFERAALDSVSLLLVGSRPPEDLRAEAAQSGGKILFPGFVSDALLAALYRRALAFVYPSLYEGFGLQLCEAMSFGCPTFASNRTSLPEVLGNGGETFSPTDPDSLAVLLRRVATNESYRLELASRARQRSLDFSWPRTAQQTYEVYRSIA